MTNERTLKIGHLAKGIGFAKSSLWVKNSICQKPGKNDCIFTLQLFCGKIAPKKSKYSRNETILKIGHLGKAIGFAKLLLRVRN